MIGANIDDENLNDKKILNIIIGLQTPRKLTNQDDNPVYPYSFDLPYLDGENWNFHKVSEWHKYERGS